MPTAVRSETPATEPSNDPSRGSYEQPKSDWYSAWHSMSVGLRRLFHAGKPLHSRGSHEELRRMWQGLQAIEPTPALPGMPSSGIT